MKKLTEKGLTLAELMISIAIMGVIMVGVMSVDFALRQSHESIGKDTYIKMQLTSLITAISNDVARATGDQSNPGIVYQTPALAPLRNMWELAVRQNPPGGDPFDYSDDTWVWYYNGSSGHLWKCTNALGIPATPPRPWPIPITCNTSLERQEIGFVKNLPASANPPQYEFISDENTHELYVNIYLESLYDNTQPEDPIRNPNAGSLSARVIPLQHTW